jgi:hypothetical protein
MKDAALETPKEIGNPTTLTRKRAGALPDQ